MRRIPAVLALSVMAATLSACMGYEKGNGISRLDTISEEDKAQAKWFKSYYGTDHCYGNWAASCEEDESSGGGGGGFWGGGIGPSD